MKTAIEPEVTAARFKALADPNRLKILSMLKDQPCCSLDKGNGMCACDIESQLDLTQPTISHHMKVLREAGLIESEKIGQWMWYRRNERALRELAEALRQDL